MLVKPNVKQNVKQNYNVLKYQSILPQKNKYILTKYFDNLKCYDEIKKSQTTNLYIIIFIHHCIKKYGLSSSNLA